MRTIQLTMRAGKVIEARCPDLIAEEYWIAIIDLDTPDEGDHENVSLVQIEREPISDAVQSVIADVRWGF